MAKGSGGGGGGGRGGFRRGDFVRTDDGALRGFIRGRGTVGRNTPAYILDIGGGRRTLVPVDQVRDAFEGANRRR